MKHINYRPISFFSFMAALLLLSGCATPNVFFFEKMARPDIHASDLGAKVVSLHLDAHGNLYPDDGYPANFEPSADDAGSLLNMSLQRGSDDEWEADRLCLESISGDAKTFCKEALGKGWEAAQSNLWKEKASEILNKFSTNSDDRTLVFLVHGFNVPAGAEAGSFALARERIEKLTKSQTDIVYIEVNWDGFIREKGNKAWSNAQSTGPLVGFKMRQLFNSLAGQSKAKNLPELKIRILGHSSSAFIVGATFGNPIGALPNLINAEKNGKKAYLDFYKDRYQVNENNANAVPQFKDLRIGIAAAATSSPTFAGYEGKCMLGPERCQNMGLLAKSSTLIFSLNPHDRALNKIIGIPNLAGASGVGTDKGTFCKVKRSERLEDMDIEVIGLDFTRNTSLNSYKTSHSFRVYLTQEQSTDFLQILMGASNSSTYLIVDCPNKSI